MSHSTVAAQPRFTHHTIIILRLYTYCATSQEYLSRILPPAASFPYHLSSLTRWRCARCIEWIVCTYRAGTHREKYSPRARITGPSDLWSLCVRSWGIVCFYKRETFGFRTGPEALRGGAYADGLEELSPTLPAAGAVLCLLYIQGRRAGSMLIRF